MTARRTDDRTARLLEARLEALARVSARWPAGPRPLDGRLLAAVAATRNAVELELISAEEASAIWTAVAERHPAVAWAHAALRLAA